MQQSQCFPFSSRFTAKGFLGLGLMACLMLCFAPRVHGQKGTLDEETVKRVEATLAENGIEPTAEGLARFLEELHPNRDTDAKIRRLIVELGDDNFFHRESAMKQLLRLPVSSSKLFEEAIDAGDAEIRWRAREVLKQGNLKTEEMLLASLQLIRHKNMQKLLPLVVKAIPFCTQGYIREEAVRVLKTIAKAEDVPLIQAALKQRDTETQRAALVTLEYLIGAEADPDLLKFLKSENESVRLTAARALGNHGHRRALPVLVDLLAAKDVLVRQRSATTLILLTGQRFAFVAYDTAANRASAKDRWANWVANNGETAKLTFPIPDEPSLLGHTLICNYSLKKVIELDANHKEIWSTDLVGAWGCKGLPNGNRLVTSYSQRAIVEYDPRGKEIWKKQILPGLPYSVERLGNGNTLVTCSNNQVLEYAPDGSIVWQQQFNGSPRDAQRLVNGNTLVALYSTQEIVEVDRKGKEVWKLANITRPMSAQRLPNGNTLVCQSGGSRLLELDPQGKTVWSPNIALSIYDAQRLPNGNTLVVGSTGATEFDAQGKTVWQLKQAGMRGIHRF